MWATCEEAVFEIKRAWRSAFHFRAQGAYYPGVPAPRACWDADANEPVLGVPILRVQTVRTDQSLSLSRRRQHDVRVRTLDVEHAIDLGLPAEWDFWLLDDEYVVCLYYDHHELLCGEVIIDTRVQQYRQWRDLAWLHAREAEEREALMN